MKIELTPIETTVFSSMANGVDGKILISFCQRLADTLVDIRNIPNENLDVEKRARSLAVNIIELNLINRLKTFRGEISPPDQDNYE